MAEEGACSVWRRRAGLLVLLAGSMASLATSPAEDEVVGGGTVDGPEVALAEVAPAFAASVVLTVEEPGADGVRLTVESDGSAVLVTMTDDDSRNRPRPTSTVVTDRSGPVELSRSAGSCREEGCETGFGVTFELLDPGGPPATVRWTAEATTIVESGESGTPGSVEIGDVVTVEPTPSRQEAVRTAVALDPEHAGDAAIVRLSGPTISMSEVDARLLVRTTAGPGPPPTMLVQVVDPDDGVPVLDAEPTTPLEAGSEVVLELHVEGESCEFRRTCERTFWVLTSTSGSGSATVDVALDVRGNSLADVVVEVSDVTRLRYDGPLTFDASGAATLTVEGSFPPETSTVAWAAASDPSARTLTSEVDVVIGRVESGYEELGVPVELEPLGTPTGFALIDGCESLAPCPRPAPLTGPPSTSLERIVIELFALAPPIPPIGRAIALGG